MVEANHQLVRITSWNVAGKDLLADTKLDYLFNDTERNTMVQPQIQIVGLQEAPQYLFSDPWTSNLSSTLNKRGYILFKRHKLSGILLYIFVLREMILRMRDMETESVKTGFGGLLGNKGGVSLRFTFDGNSFCATNSHLAAHLENLEQRVQDYNSILTNTKFRIDTNTPDLLKHDYSFWFGDLNFRLDNIETREVLDKITLAKSAGSNEEKIRILSSLHEHDQLIRVKKKGDAFVDFEETKPQFLPTYKYHIGKKDHYDSEHRVPAWTDRILFRHGRGDRYLESYNFTPKVEQIFFDCLQDFVLSDHKPVVSLFKVAVFEHNPSPIPYEVVKFLPIHGWMENKDGRLWYKISNDLFSRRPKVLSSWDHLALYRSNFSSLEDYLTIVSVNNIARMSPELDAQEVAYLSSNPPSRSTSPNISRRGSTSSNDSVPTVGTEAITLNRTTTEVFNSSSTSELNPQRSPRPVVPVTVSPIDDSIIGDGFKYFTATFPDDFLLKGDYVVIYLKTNAANEYDVYGISETFSVSR